MPAREDDFQAEDDARTLVRAEEVRNDNKRLKKAKKKLSKMKQEAEEAANRKKLEANVASKLKKM